MPSSPLKERAELLHAWHRNGGVMILGYDMFRILVESKSKGKSGPAKRRQDTFHKCLVQPGIGLDQLPLPTAHIPGGP